MGAWKGTQALEEDDDGSEIAQLDLVQMGIFFTEQSLADTSGYGKEAASVKKQVLVE